jgi:hypothetical protein
VHDTLRVLGSEINYKKEYSSYSPGLASFNFWLIQKLKNDRKGQRFGDIPDIQRNVTTLLAGIPENDFQDSFRQWRDRLTKCKASQGEYCKGGSSR